jgi:hypothetical protein
MLQQVSTQSVEWVDVSQSRLDVWRGRLLWFILHRLWKRLSSQFISVRENLILWASFWGLQMSKTTKHSKYMLQQVLTQSVEGVDVSQSRPNVWGGILLGFIPHRLWKGLGGQFISMSKISSHELTFKVERDLKPLKTNIRTQVTTSLNSICRRSRC